MWSCLKEWILPNLSYPEGEEVRTRKQIELDGSRKDMLILEVLLDIRGLLVKASKKKTKLNKESVK